MRRIMLLFAMICIALSAATAAQNPPADNPERPDPDAQVTFDGLHKIKKSKFQYAWAKPDIDLGRYTKVMAGDPVLQFRAVRPSASRRYGVSTASEFPISAKNQKKLAETLAKEFETELAKSTRFETTGKSGGDVLKVEIALIDVVSRVPPEPPGRGSIYVERLGEATLVVQLIDSQSGEVLARAVERRAVEPVRSGVRVNAVMTWNEVRRTMSRWARKAREGLDSFPGE